MIETLNIKPAKTPDELKGIARQMIDPKDAGTLIKSSVKIKCDGRLKAVLLKDSIDPDVYDYTLATMEALKFTPSRRKAVKQSKIGRDLILGWYEDINKDVFRGNNRDQWPQYVRLSRILLEFQWLMRRHVPEYWEVHWRKALLPRHDAITYLHLAKDLSRRDMIKRFTDIELFYSIFGTSFTTLTLNKNILFGAHEDGSNVKGTLGCLTALGDYAGGILCFPRLGICFNLRPRDLLIADTNEEFHTNLGPIVGTRYSLVAYLHGTLENGVRPSFDPHGIFRGFKIP